MPLRARLFRMLRTLFRRSDLERDLDEELQSYLLLATDEKVRAGMSPEAARRAALIDLGGVEQVKEEVRRVRVGALVHTTVLDARYALRTFRRRPGFALSAVATLGLGIGATVTIFSVVEAVVLRPLPFPDPKSLVRLYEVTPQGHRYTTSEPTFLDWHTATQSFAEVAACTGAALDLTGVAEPVALLGQAVSHDFTSLLGMDVILGRGFTVAEDAPGQASNVVILGRGVWENTFGGSTGVIGRSITLGGTPRTVVGVAELRKLSLIDGNWKEFLIPLTADPSASRSNHLVVALARLKPGISLQTAQAEMTTVAARLGRAYPKSNEGWGAEVVPVTNWLVGPDVSRAVFQLFAAVALLLLLACANVSSLLVAHGTGRLGEIGMRAALGASRGRIVRQLLTESLVLAVLGAVVGLLLCVWAIPLIRTLGPVDIPRLDEVRVSGAVLAFTVVASILSTLLAGLVPALQVSRKGIYGTLREHAPTVVTDSRLRDLLAVSQLAIATVVLIAAGLMTRSFVRLVATDPGFEAAGVSTLRLRLPSSTPKAEREAFYATICERLSTLPGVAAVGATFTVPFGDGFTSNRVSSPDRNPTSPDDFVAVQFRLVTHGIFGAIGIPLRVGRLLDDRDGTDRQDGGDTNVVVNEALAVALWPQKDPVGREVLWRNLGGPRFCVVGVVGNIRDVKLESEPQPMLYLPYGAWPQPSMSLMIRATQPQAELAAAIRDEIRRLHPAIVVPDLEPLSAGLARAVAAPRFLVRLLGAFGLLALAIASIGVYAVVAAQVAGHRKEFGLRMALGAGRSSILALVLHRGVGRIVLGLLVGLVAALALSRLVASALYETAATDPLAYGGVLGLLGTVATLATLVPAVRATRVDPRLALAAE